MKRALFEVTTLADAVSKASRVAPTKGAAHDKAAGVVLTVTANRTDTVLVATDTEVTFRMVVTAVEVGDEDATWRISSGLLNGFMQSLQSSQAGSTVVVTEYAKDPSRVYLTSGSVKAKFSLLTGNYPRVDAYDGAQLGVVSGLARRLRQVAWACDAKRGGALAGIHLNGTHLFATDSAKAAMVPCEVPVDRPVTAPLSEVAALLRNTQEVKLRADANHLEVMPDDYTQTTSVLIHQDYPNVAKVIEIERPFNTEVNSESFQSAIERMMVLVKGDRYPRITMEFGLDSLRVEMEVPEVGKIIEELHADGGDAAPFTTVFNPLSLRQAVEGSGRPTVTLGYGPTPKSPVRISDDDHYRAIIMPFAGAQS